MSWARVVSAPDEGPGDALVLHAAEPLPGFVELAPGEWVRPVPQVLSSPGQTRALGVRLAGGLRAGDLLVLSGPLGAGKTALAQGIGKGLGVEGLVTSPTFALARVHRGAPPLVHVDAYRLRESGAGLADMEDLDLDVDLARAVVVVEWGEGLVEALSDSRLEVHLDRPAGAAPDLRTASVAPYGRRWAVLTAGG